MCFSALFSPAQPSITPPPPPEPPKQTEKAPDAAGVRAKNKNAMASGMSSTMLTGPGGIDPTSLSIGKNTLLGG